MQKRKLALIVDDVDMNRDILKDMLEDSYDILEAENGLQALELAEQYADRLSVVLLDLVMPEMDGYAVLQEMYARGWTNRVPVLIISGETNMDSEQRCFEMGVVDYIHKPFNRVLVDLRVNNASALFSYKNHLEEIVQEQTEELRRVNAKLRRQNENITDILGNVVEARNQESGEHVYRVKELTRILAEHLESTRPELGLTDELVERIACASVLHDVGKIMIPDAVLLKPGRLTQEEFELMKKHTLYGCTVLDNSKMDLDADYARMALEICRSHHEKWDGRGYPDGLKGNEIPLSAQLVSLADCYDALTQERVYKKAFTPGEAYRMIQAGECGAFNPLILQCFTECREAMEEITKSTEKEKTA